MLALHELDASSGDVGEFFLEPPLFLWRRMLHERIACGGKVIEGTEVFIDIGLDIRCSWHSVRACVLEGVASGRCRVLKCANELNALYSIVGCGLDRRGDDEWDIS